jgi:ATP-dependent Zn protease
MKKSEEYYIAIHEAGHAVAAYILKKDFEYVTISPKDDSNGHILYYLNDWEKLKALIEGTSFEIKTQEEIRNLVENEIIITYSGYTSELKYGVDDKEGASSDFDKIKDIALFFIEDITDTLCDDCYIKSQKLVEENWTSITNLATILMERKTLEYKEIDSILKEQMPPSIN